MRAREAKLSSLWLDRRIARPIRPSGPAQYRKECLNLDFTTREKSDEQSVPPADACRLGNEAVLPARFEWALRRPTRETERGKVIHRPRFDLPAPSRRS